MVPAPDRIDDLGQQHLLPPSLKFQPAPPSACLGCGVEIKFELSLRKHHSADITAIHHNATAAPKLLLLPDEDGAQTLKCSHPRSPLAHRLAANGLRDIAAINMHGELPIADGELKRELRAELNKCRLIVPGNPPFCGAQCDGSVHGARIDVPPSEMPCQAKRYGTLPRPCRSIDGNNWPSPPTGALSGRECWW